MTADELREQAVELTLVRFVEALETQVVGVTVEMLNRLDFPNALLDFVQSWERAPNDADTGVAPLPSGIQGWGDDEDTQPIGVHNRSNP